VELLGKVRDRGVGTAELLQNAASGGIRKRGERVIQAGLRILNHMVQYTLHGLERKRRPSADWRLPSSVRARFFAGTTRARYDERRSTNALLLTSAAGLSSATLWRSEVNAGKLGAGVRGMTARHEYRLELAVASHRSALPVPVGISARAISPADLRELAELMLDAYRNTVDYEGEGIAEAVAEVEDYFSLEAEDPAIPQHSVVLMLGQTIACACMVRFWRRRSTPLIGYVICRPEYKRQGLATFALYEVIRRLRRAGYAELRAVITDGNVASESLFARAGFERVGQ